MNACLAFALYAALLALCLGAAYWLEHGLAAAELDADEAESVLGWQETWAQDGGDDALALGGERCA